MPQELNLDQLSDAMRKQQEGNTNGKQIVWDKNKMTFVQLSNNEPVNNNTQSVVNGVSWQGFFNN